MKKLLTGILVLSAFLFTTGITMACDCGCKDENCGCKCHQECLKDCDCGCHNGTNCDKENCNCECHKKCAKDCECGCHKKVKLFRKNK